MTVALTSKNYQAPMTLALEDLVFDNVFAELPPEFYCRHRPDPLDGQFLIHFNDAAAALIGLNSDEARRVDFLDVLTVPERWPGTDPIAMCYAGHQFGQYVPRLGDGRALLLGQVKNQNGTRWDLQLKGSGLTRYSRQGDGKAVLRSSIREYLCSAALHGLGIPTTHALALFGSNEEVYREQVETGAMILRMAPSHIRFGTFEYYFYKQRFDDLKTLGNFVLDHYYLHLKDTDQPFLGLLEEVMSTTARLIAQWQSVGFCHGVMNSDNMSIHGLTIDYGPYGFMDNYQAGHICNHSDHSGRYAFDRQPAIGLFNLSCFAQAILPLLDDDPDAAVEKATSVLQKYQDLFERNYLELKRKKLGLECEDDSDSSLYENLLQIMESCHADFTNTFRSLCCLNLEQDSFNQKLGTNARFQRWLDDYKERLRRETAPADARAKKMKLANPRYVLRNYMAENAIRSARDNQDFTEIDRLMSILANPYADQKGYQNYASDAPEWSAGLAVSCSS